MNLLNILNKKNQFKSHMKNQSGSAILGHCEEQFVTKQSFDGLPRANTLAKAHTCQSGSIMLEVVAVLALMGVMGAMLFRQIYQRNQELHNIQMASEIRTVKEAFSAYIQANRSSVLSTCTIPVCNADGCLVESCTVNEGTYDAVADYLPDGWFVGNSAEDDYLGNAYTLTLWNYLQENTGKRVVYGIVVPTTDTLPTTGWNFRRAARVALLVGADGGAYDPTITNGEIAGALGSWQIEATGIIKPNCLYVAGKDDYDATCSTYVATTGIDLFSPEYELPEGKVAIPADWNLALQDLHAYNYFSVGNSSTNSPNCYSIERDTSDNRKRKYEGSGENTILKNDTVTKELSNACKPLFWVGAQDGAANASSGNVYVATDLNIGGIETVGASTTHNEALKLTAEGVIKQKEGLTIDKDGRIIAKETVSAAIGDLAAGEHFVLDPAYTSTMNDIRLTSRGGVRLSDILPNYILKTTQSGMCTLNRNGKPKSPGSSTTFPSDTGSISDVSWCDLGTYPFPTCPTDYSAVVVVIPSNFGQKSFIKTKTEHDHGVSGAASVDIVNDVEECAFFIGTRLEGSEKKEVSTLLKGTGDFIVTAGYRRQDQGGTNNYPKACIVNNDKNETIHAVIQTYCVWTPSLYDGNKDKCEAAGYEYSSGKCTTNHALDTDMTDNLVKGADRSNSYLSETFCHQAGYAWEGGKCITTKFHTTASDITDKSGCIAAGFKWNQCSTTTGCCYTGSSSCSCS